MKGKVQGKIAERIAEKFLRRKGYIILARNFRCFLGEIDLVAIQPRSIWQRFTRKILPSSVMVFVEVKSQRKEEGLAEYRIDNRKQEKLKSLVLYFLQHHHLLQHPWRIDAVIVKLRGKKARIKHLRNVVEDSKGAS